MDINQFQKAEKNQQYFSGMRPVFNRKALFTDMSEDYVSPMEPSAYGEITVRFRAAKNNIDKVFFVHKNVKHLMFKTESDDYFDYYSHTIQLENEKLSYYFEVHAGKLSCFFDMRGVTKDTNEYYQFHVIPGFKTPDWAKGAVFYQIYVDRFYNGDPTNDVLTNEYQYIGDKTVKVEDWDKYPAAMGVREFYGGDLQGVLDKMDYLQDLGVDVIYFNPLFVSPSNHKYDIQDYDYIDPHFGKIVHDEGELLKPEQTENRLATRYIDRVSNKENLEASNELFAEVVKEAHRRGMKVILDGVFNHCGSFNKWLDRERIYENAPGYEKGAYIDKDSPYHSYFQFHDENKFPYNGSYDGWWGHDTLPKLNYENSRQLLDYVLYIGRKWVSPPYNADGWRLDVAADLGHTPEFNHSFWKEFRKTVKMANPNAIILAEHYGSPVDWLQGQEWDTVMNYDAFMEPVTWFLTGMQKHSDDYREDMRGNADSFWGAMRHHCAAFTMPSILVAMNELSNHDHSRFLTRTNHKVGRTNTLGPQAADEGVNKAVLREAVVIQMTWPGAPTIYYGDEAGVCGFTDPDNRRTYPWGHEDKELIAFHKEIIRIHKTHQEFLTGSLKYLDADYNVIGYGRFNREGQSVILVNNNDYEITREVSVWYLGIPKECVLNCLMLTTWEGYSTEPKQYPVISGKVKVTLPATSAIILRHEKPREQKERKFLRFF
ncbi:MAG: glycoside hydrolase family 13 protein [Lachnospiraceae bacterium]|jgi:alpha-glucosidase|nr:glycoside hydrolase family 13 protein [Lachnospiraceae bacterium]